MLGERGDTIVEVLLAFTVFATVATIGLAAMNQGSSSAQQTLERALVKQEVDTQAELLRAIHKQDGSTWGAIKAVSYTTTSPVITTTCPNQTSLDATFALAQDAAATAVVRLTPTPLGGASAPPYARLIYTSGSATAYGIWIEKTDKNDGTYDFTIKACWYGPGAQVPMQMQTVVRLYDL